MNKDERLEQEIKKKLVPLRIWCGIVNGSLGLFCLSVLLLILSIFLKPGMAILTVFIVMCVVSSVLVITLGIKVGSKVLAFREYIKNNVMKPIFESYFDNITYFPKHYNTGCQGEGNIMVEGWSLAEGEDLIQGVYKDVPFTFSNTELFHVRANGNKVPLFKGQWLTFDFKVPLERAIILRERNFKHRTFRGKAHAKTLQKQKSRKERDKHISINTDSTEFNKKFFIISEDQHMVFYVLTPHFMEFLFHLDEAVEADTSVCFAGTKANFAFNNNKYMFDFKSNKIFSNNLLEEFKEQCHREAKCITAIIEELLINETLFEKRGGN
ncbi:MAG: DUF3137 domain-containing protein [Oscillospiraceae bacterium]|nr:DUF3137 domain-containing protein [Oscillospiraceae bacterium]